MHKPILLLFVAIYVSILYVILHRYIVWVFTCIPSCIYCMCAHRRGNGKVKLHSGAIRQDTRSKYTHFLISHIGQPAAPQETNNGLVITPRQHTKELLSRNSSDFTTEKHAHLPIQFMSDCTKGLPKEWRWVQISPHLLTPAPHVVSLLVKLALYDKALQCYSGT